MRLRRTGRLGRFVGAAAMAGLLSMLVASPLAAQVAVVATNDAATTAEDTAVTIDVLANDTPAGVTLETVTDPANGTATISGGAVVYTPDADFHGTDTFTYTISDGTTTDAAVVTVTVTPVNDPPVAHDDAATTQVDTAVVIDVLADDEDADGDDLTVVLQSAPASGTLALDTTTQQVTYTPNAGFTGTDSFIYQAADGEANSGTATVTIQVKAKPTSDGKMTPEEVCEAGAAPFGLCQVYLEGKVPPWVQEKIGKLILLFAPKPDPVLEACGEDDLPGYVETLCDLYQSDDVPEGVQKKIGAAILVAVEGESELSSKPDKDKKPWKHGKPWGDDDDEDDD